jgi:hypothetical protein
MSWSLAVLCTHNLVPGLQHASENVIDQSSRTLGECQPGMQDHTQC